MNSIHVPIYQSDETIEILVEGLTSQNPEDIIRLLIDEKAPLEIWLRIAIEYYKLGRYALYQSMLNIGTLRSGMPSPYVCEKGEQTLPEDREKELLAEWTMQGGGKIYKNYDKAMILCLDSLAAFYINLARLEKESKKRNEIYAYANKLFNRADQTSKNHWHTGIGKGLAYLYQGVFDKSLRQFQSTLNSFESRAARTGLAVCYVQQGNLAEALQELTRVLMSIYLSTAEPVLSANKGDSDAPPTSGDDEVDAAMHVVLSNYQAEVELLTTYEGLRPAIALVWQRLHCFDQAICALNLQISSLEYVQKKNPSFPTPKHHDETLTMLTIFLLNKFHACKLRAKTAQELNEANQYLIQANTYMQRALKLNPNNPNALNYWVNVVFTHRDFASGDFTNTKKMATKAYHHATLDGTKAEGCYHLGRAYHAAGDYEMALKYYSEATINWPQFPLPHYGLGQLYLARKQYLQAIENLQKVDSKYLDIPEVKNLLGHTYAQLIDAPSTSSSKIVEYREKAVSYFERSLKLSPHQPDIWIELAQVCQYFEPLQALRAYENASDLLNSVHAYKKLFSNPADPKNPSHEPTPPPSDEAVIDLLKKLPTPCRQLWNNIGVLLITLKDFHRALDVFLRTILAGACYSCIRSSPPAILPTHAVLFDSFYKSPSPRSRSSTSPLKTVFAPPSFSSPSSSIDLSLIRLALYAKSIKDPLDSSQHKLLFRACLDNEWLLLPQNVTVAFNLAYLHETGLHDINTAHLLYERILQRYPGYLDAIFRLACIERDFGQVSRAIDQFSKVYQGEWSCLPTATPDRHKTACIYLANIHMHLKDYKSAQSYLEKFLNQHTADKKKLTSGQATIDLYALTQLANIFLIAAAIPNDRRERNLKYATDLFSSVLKQSPGNLYATNGLGITLALRGTPTHYQNATDIFHAVREGSSSIPDVFINLGHVYFIQGDHYQAIRMYSNFLTKFGPHLPQVSQSRLFTMLSRCYFETGNFELAKFTLQHSLHLNPSDNDTWYNLAVMCKDLGLSVLKHVDSNFTPSNDGLEPSNIHKSSSSKYVSVPTEAEQRAAIEALKVATPIFERLHTDASSSTSKHSFIPSKCSKFAKLCSTNRELAEEKLAAFKEEQLRLSQLREARLSEAREREAQRLQELELKRAHELRRIKELELQAKEYIQRTAALQQEWAASHDDKKSNDSNDDLDDGVISVPKKRRRKQEESLESSLKKTSSLNHE